MAGFSQGLAGVCPGLVLVAGLNALEWLAMAAIWVGGRGSISISTKTKKPGIRLRRGGLIYIYP